MVHYKALVLLYHYQHHAIYTLTTPAPSFTHYITGADALLHEILTALGLGLELLSLEPSRAALSATMGPKAHGEGVDLLWTLALRCQEGQWAQLAQVSIRYVLS